MSNRYSIFAQMPGDQGPQPAGQPSPVPPPQPQPAQPMQGNYQGQPQPVQIPPPAPGPNEDQDELKMYREAKRRQRIVTLASVAIIAIIAIGVGYFFLFGPKVIGPAGTTSITTTVASAQVFQIASCQAITKPGTYYLSSSISTSISNGSCIDIKSPSVTVIGNGNKITGSGPYVSLPPYTYGILFDNVSGDTVKGITVSKFSYGVYFANSSGDTFVNSTISNATVSGVYFSASDQDSVLNDSISGAESDKGAIDMASGSGELILGDVIQGNAFYGAVVNTDGNKFSGDNFIDNPIDLYCPGPAGYKSANNFSSTKCSINQFCDFAVCSTQNLPSNISEVVLQPQVAQCGSIVSPGSYSLENDLNLSIYENTSSNLGKGLACITISSSNVRLDCNGNAVIDSGYGVSILAESPGLYNVSVNDCRFVNDTVGVAASSTLQLSISKMSATGGTFGVYFTNVTTGAVSNSTIQGNEYGIYLNGTYGVTFLNTTTTKNQYGVFVANGTSNVYQQSSFTNNTKQDFYCSAATYGSQGNIFQNNRCGSSDCQWATSCSTKTLPPISTYPLTSCGAITSPGNYSLSADVNTQNNCLRIEASNVTLNCGGKEMFGINSGSAISGVGVSNVIISNCHAVNFRDGINFTGGSYITVENNVFTNNSNSSIVLSGGSFDKVENNTALYFARGGFIITSISNSIITNNSARESLGGSDGYDFVTSQNDIIQSDLALGNEGYGFSFVSSKRNAISNNTSESNGKQSYYCSPDTSGFFAEDGGINQGVDKVGCLWLIAVPPNNLGQQCAAISSSALISFSYDMVYTYGATCFSVYTGNMISGNNTVINCHGHTIIATDGGTFVDIGNASSVTVKNCYLKGFTSPIIASGDYAQVLNNTIDGSNVSIVLLNGRFGTAELNTIFNASYGLFIDNAQYATVQDNNMFNDNVSISLFGGSGSTVDSNNATGGSVGLYLVNSGDNDFMDNMLVDASAADAVCTSGSQNVSSDNRDSGGNVCSINVGCKWMTLSPQCRPTS